MKETEVGQVLCKKIIVMKGKYDKALWSQKKREQENVKKRKKERIKSKGGKMSNEKYNVRDYENNEQGRN